MCSFWFSGFSQKTKKMRMRWWRDGRREPQSRRREHATNQKLHLGRSTSSKVSWKHLFEGSLKVLTSLNRQTCKKKQKTKKMRMRWWRDGRREHQSRRAANMLPTKNYTWEDPTSSKVSWKHLFEGSLTVLTLVLTRA
jgi:hypothetical protein